MRIVKYLQLWNRTRSHSHADIRTVYQTQLKLIRQEIAATSFLAVDLEMTGLEVKKDHILSIAWVPIQNMEIQVENAEHYLINTRKDVGQSATIHGIKDTDKQQGEFIPFVMKKFIQSCENKILLFHHAKLDISFINKVIRSTHQATFKPAIIDTMALEKARLTRQQIPIKPGALRLSECRKRYNLPSYNSHSALTDALATAELFLALTSNVNKGRTGDFLL